MINEVETTRLGHRFQNKETLDIVTVKYEMIDDIENRFFESEQGDRWNYIDEDLYYDLQYYKEKIK